LSLENVINVAHILVMSEPAITPPTDARKFQAAAAGLGAGGFITTLFVYYFGPMPDYIAAAWTGLFLSLPALAGVWFTPHRNP
jgi:hypothetical protein